MRFIVACDGYGLLFELLHGLDPSVDDRVDSDGDGWMDWQEKLAGTSWMDPGESPWSPDGFPKIFSVTLTVLEPPDGKVSVSIGDKTLVVSGTGSGGSPMISTGMGIASAGGDITLWLREGVAHDVSLFAENDCRLRLGVSISSSCAAFQGTHPAFTAGGELRGGVATASGMIAQPALSVSPVPMCFHTKEDMQVSASVLPEGINGIWGNYLSPVWDSGSGNSRTVSYYDAFNFASFEFHADEAPQSRYVGVDITRCTRLEDEEPNPPYEYNPEPEQTCDCCDGGGGCRCPCHTPDKPVPVDGEPLLYYIGEQDEEYGHGGGMLVPVNNDDDDASETEDRADEDMFSHDNDLVAFYPLGIYDGECCPCPEHKPSIADTATLISNSSQLLLWLDSSKSNAFSGTINAGGRLYVEGRWESEAVGDGHLRWQYSKDGETHCLTNSFTVLSQRIFADLDFDGDVDSFDKALRGAFPDDYVWTMGVDTNAFRVAQLRTDVGLTGIYTLRLDGDPAYKVWQSSAPATNHTPLLVAGQTVTNGVDGVWWNTGSTANLYLQSVTNGTSILTYTFMGTGEAEGIISRASLKMTAGKVDFVDATSTEAGTSLNPPPFEGCKPWPFDVTRSPNPDKHMVVFYKDVVDSAFNEEDFDVLLTANYSPASIQSGDIGGFWSKTDGPDSGVLDQGNDYAVYSNPKLGGVYRFSFDSYLEGDANISVANVVLPLAGAEMDDVMKSDLLLADAFAAKVNAKYASMESEKAEQFDDWFWNYAAGDYTGRPDNALTPTVWAYNQIQDGTGFGAVCTWKGRPVRLTKLSNFILGYTMQQIGVSREFARLGTNPFTFEETTDKASVGAGWDVANGADYDTTVANLVNYIWMNEDEDDKSRKLWPNPNAPDNYMGSSSTNLFNRNTGYGAPGFLFMEP